MTGRSPAELLYGRKIRTKLPGLRVQQQGELDKEVREKHERERQKQKLYADEKRKAKLKEVKPGDQVMVQQRKSTVKTPWDPNPYTVIKVKGSQVELMRGDDRKRRALNLVKKVKFRQGGEKRETKSKDTEDPDIDITIEEIRRRIRQEKEVTEANAQEQEPAGDGAQETQGLDESTDSDFTITYEEGPSSPEVVGAEDGEKDRAAVGGPVKRLSPRQRLRRQSLARNKKKQWGAEWMLQL